MRKEKDSVYCLRSHYVPLLLSVTAHANKFVLLGHGCDLSLARRLQSGLTRSTIQWRYSNRHSRFCTLQVPRVLSLFLLPLGARFQYGVARVLIRWASSLIFWQNSAKKKMRDGALSCVFPCAIFCSVLPWWRIVCFPSRPTSLEYARNHHGKVRVFGKIKFVDTLLVSTAF